VLAENKDLPPHLRIEAEVFASLSDGQITIVLLPRSSAAKWVVPIERVPFDCRISNCPLWVTFEGPSPTKIIKIERRRPASVQEGEEISN
jgi:hypothetical protein